MNTPHEAIKKFLDTLWFPLYFLDFETFQQAIPLFGQQRPYQQIPFQYSLHFFEEEGGELQHLEFLADGTDDPRRALAEKLVKDVPTDACVLTYNMGFEKSILRRLADLIPAYSDHLKAIVDNVRDLREPFQKRHYYTAAMRGSSSIKDVLPALIPELNYEGLAIGDGTAAMNAFHNLSAIDDETERNTIRQALVDYCRLDTLGMVKILERIKWISFL